MILHPTVIELDERHMLSKIDLIHIADPLGMWQAWCGADQAGIYWAEPVTCPDCLLKLANEDWLNTHLRSIT